MEQIDVIQYEKDLKKQRLKRFIKNKQALSAAFIAAANIPGAIMNDTAFFRAFNTFIIGLEISMLRRYWKREGIVEEAQTIDMLRTTTTYKELEEEYQKYVKDVAELIRHVGLKSSKEVVMYLQALMELGYFAKGMKHKYKIFKYERDYLSEMCGAKIVTGTSVCRHMSSFFVDVLNAMNYTAANISVTHDDENPVKRIQRRNVILNHAVAGVIDNGQKFLFDPTCGQYAALPQNFDFTEIESIHVSQFVVPDVKKYLIMCPKLDILNVGRDEQCKIINTSKLATITVGEVEYIRRKIEQVVQGNMYNQFGFFVSHEQQRQKIEQLYQELLPYSDEKIEKHIVRK